MLVRILVTQNGREMELVNPSSAACCPTRGWVGQGLGVGEVVAGRAGDGYGPAGAAEVPVRAAPLSCWERTPAYPHLSAGAEPRAAGLGLGVSQSRVLV